MIIKLTGIGGDNTFPILVNTDYIEYVSHYDLEGYTFVRTTNAEFEVEESIKTILARIDSNG